MKKNDLAKKLKKLEALLNEAKHGKLTSMVVKLRKKNPEDLLLAYYEALLGAGEEMGFSVAKDKASAKKAVGKFSALLKKYKGLSAEQIATISNGVHWFSGDYAKQVALGVKAVKAGDKNGYYSQGVGAAMLAVEAGFEGKSAACVAMAKKSEKAFKAFFKHDAKWASAYPFYARALGLQENFEGMEKALKKCAKLTGKKIGWEPLKIARADVADAHIAMD